MRSATSTCALRRCLWVVPLVALVLGVGSMVGGCGARDTRPWNVVVVLVDTLRADRLSLYGHARATSPVLDAFEGVVFENTTSQAGCTFPSVNSLLTSRYPFHFLRPNRRDMSMREDIPTLGQILQQHGYATAAVSASPIARNLPSLTNGRGGFGQGFETFHEECQDDDASCVNGAAFELIEAMSKPFFLYLHYMEPHNPYQPPASHPRRFATFESDRWFIREGQLRPIARMLDGKSDADLGLTAKDWEDLRALYDEEILYFDTQFQVLRDHLTQRGLLDRTMIVVLSDHGEELFDHGHVSHCRDLAYESVLATPLVMKIPGVVPARRQARVQNLDVVPTILDYLGYGHELASLDGTSLRPVIEADQEVHRFVFAMQGASRVVISKNLKLIHDLRNGRSMLFDLAADPGETHDLALERPAELAELELALERWLERVERNSEDSVDRSDEVRRQLDAVGYL